MEVNLEVGGVAESSGSRQEAGIGLEAVWGKGVPLTITPPSGKHRPDAEVAVIGQKGIEPKVRVQMRCGAPEFLA